MAKELELKKASELSTIVHDFEDDAGGGLDNFSAQDYSIPYIAILQALSPQLKKSSGVSGATAGGIFNPLTGEVMNGDSGIMVIPCAYDKKWVEWKPRETGGGFVNSYDDDSLMATTSPSDKGPRLPNGNFLVQTAHYYCLLLRSGEAPQTVVIPMSKTQIKKSKKWNSLMGSIRLQGKMGLYTPPMFSHKWLLSSVEEEKNGHSWYGWEVVNAGRLNMAVQEDKALYDLAKKVNQEVMKGLIKVRPVEEEQADVSEVM